MSQRHESSRRRFLRAAGLLSASALIRDTGKVLLALEQSALDKRRAEIGAAPIVTTRLTDRVALLSGPGGNVVVLHGPGGLLVIDAFVKPAWPKLKSALADFDRLPIKSLVDTHWHFDHADNNGSVRDAGAGVIAHENTKIRLMQSHDLLGMHLAPTPSAELPTQTFQAGLTLNINGEQVDLRHLPPAHTDGDILVYFPKADVLHTGDVFFNGFYPFIDASTGGTIDGMIDAIGIVEKRVTAQTRIVPGHGPLATRGSLQTYARMLTTIRDRIGSAKKAGKSLADVQAAKPTAEFDAAWGKGGLAPNDFIALVYNTVK